MRAKPYHAPFWLPGGHLQTLYPFFFSLLKQPPYRRERWELDDGDFIDLDWLDSAHTSPIVVLFHGLEGHSRGHYARSLMAKLQTLGWRGVTPHFRGCSGTPNRLPRAYHAGDVAEIDMIVRRLKTEHPDTPLYAVGVSLGGNALLKWLGEQGSGANSVIEKAVAVSAPVDLVAAGRALDKGFNRLYVQHFLSTLKPKALQKLDRFPALFDRHLLRKACTLYKFDDLVTAPLHGYKNVDDYWTKASSKPGLKNIRVPTLLINARNDPFLPATALPFPDQVASCVTLEFPQEGGHVGFLSGTFPGNLNWLPARIGDFLDVPHNRRIIHSACDPHAIQ